MNITNQPKDEDVITKSKKLFLGSSYIDMFDYLSPKILSLSPSLFQEFYIRIHEAEFFFRLSNGNHREALSVMKRVGHTFRTEFHRFCDLYLLKDPQKEYNNRSLILYDFLTEKVFPLFKESSSKPKTITIEEIPRPQVVVAPTKKKKPKKKKKKVKKKPKQVNNNLVPPPPPPQPPQGQDDGGEEIMISLKPPLKLVAKKRKKPMTPSPVPSKKKKRKVITKRHKTRKNVFEELEEEETQPKTLHDFLHLHSCLPPFSMCKEKESFFSSNYEHAQDLSPQSEMVAITRVVYVTGSLDHKKARQILNKIDKKSLERFYYSRSHKFLFLECKSYQEALKVKKNIHDMKLEKTESFLSQRRMKPFHSIFFSISLYDERMAADEIVGLLRDEIVPEITEEVRRRTGFHNLVLKREDSHPSDKERSKWRLQFRGIRSHVQNWIEVLSMAQQIIFFRLGPKIWKFSLDMEYFGRSREDFAVECKDYDNGILASSRKSFRDVPPKVFWEWCSEFGDPRRLFYLLGRGTVVVSFFCFFGAVNFIKKNRRVEVKKLGICLEIKTDGLMKDYESLFGTKALLENSMKRK